MRARIVDGKKFLWHGRSYDSQADAEAARQAYEADGFETCMENEDGKLLLYSRRIARVTAEGAPDEPSTPPS